MTIILGHVPNEIIEAPSATWNTVSGKPVVFPPEYHIHETSEVTGLDSELTTIDSRLDTLESNAANTEPRLTAAENDINAAESNIIDLQNGKANLSGAMFTGNTFLPNTGFVLEEDFISLSTQLGSPLDTPKNVLFGAAKTSPSSLVSIDNDGTFTILKGGPFAAKTRIRAGRVGAALTTQMFFWVEVSTDGGTTWQVNGNAVDIRLENATDSRVFFDFSTVVFPTGTKFRTRFSRSSTGVDAGDLIASLPSLALQALGVPTSPSAQLTIYRDRSYNYV